MVSTLKNGGHLRCSKEWDQDGTGATLTLHKQGSQVVVASPGDASKLRLAATTRLAGRETEPRGKLAPIAEHRCVTHAGGHRIGGDEPDAGQIPRQFRQRIVRLLQNQGTCRIRGRTTVLPIRDALRRRRPASASSSAWTRDRQRAATRPQDVGVQRALAKLAQRCSADCR